MTMDPAAMRKRFHTLRAERDAIRTKSAPLRTQRDTIENEARAKCAEIDAIIKKIEAPLPAVKTEMAMIARALNGKTGAN